MHISTTLILDSGHRAWAQAIVTGNPLNGCISSPTIVMTASGRDVSSTLCVREYGRIKNTLLTLARDESRIDAAKHRQLASYFNALEQERALCHA